MIICFVGHRVPCTSSYRAWCALGVCFGVVLARTHCTVPTVQYDTTNSVIFKTVRCIIYKSVYMYFYCTIMPHVTQSRSHPNQLSNAPPVQAWSACPLTLIQKKQPMILVQYNHTVSKCTVQILYIWVFLPTPCHAWRAAVSIKQYGIVLSSRKQEISFATVSCFALTLRLPCFWVLPPRKQNLLWWSSRNTNTQRPPFFFCCLLTILFSAHVAKHNWSSRWRFPYFCIHHQDEIETTT